VIPAKLRGASDVIRVLEQTPHSLLWDFDAIAYIALGLVTLVLIPAFEKNGVERWVRRACMANVVATLLSGVVYFYPTFSNRLLMLGLPWAVAAPACLLLLAITLRRGRSTVDVASPDRDHSTRSVTMGSARAARRAGMEAATSAMNARNAATRASVKGSRGLAS
jgi:hypothetical protein